MEFVCIEAKAFMEMNEALEAVEKHDGRRCDRFGKNGSSGREAGNKKSG